MQLTFEVLQPCAYSCLPYTKSLQSRNQCCLAHLRFPIGIRLSDSLTTDAVLFPTPTTDRPATPWRAPRKHGLAASWIHRDQRCRLPSQRERWHQDEVRRTGLRFALERWQRWDIRASHL